MCMCKVRWGILSTAKIGTGKVIPGMMKSHRCELVAIASRELQKAERAVGEMNLQKAYGSYESLLADPDIDAIYNPLPNHLHVDWSIKALEAGKHVLCEKPLGLNAKDAKRLVDAAAGFPKLKVMEAFMYRFHPQWKTARSWAKEGRIGRLKTIQSFFSYYNTDPNNIRNKAEIGGGGLMDIGCYSVSLSRFLFGKKPNRVSGIVERDSRFDTDSLTSGILDFGEGTSTFTCSTQLFYYQRVKIFGTEGMIEIEIPFNAPPDEETKMWLHTGDGIEESVFPICDQYALQGDAFSKSVLENTPVPTPLSDAIENMEVIDAIYKSGESGSWEDI